MGVDNKIHEGLLPPLVVYHTNVMNWADSADVVVVGYGGAGAVTARQAKVTVNA